MEQSTFTKTLPFRHQKQKRNRWCIQQNLRIKTNMESKLKIQSIIGDSRGALSGSGRHIKRPYYKRHPKPPYSYLGLAVMAIELSDSKRLTLSGVQEGVKKMFPFFAGEYKGWKDSIRHNISSNNCFVKTDCSGNVVVKGKSKFWSVDLNLVPPDAFKRQETKVSRDGDWALYLHEELGVPPLFKADKTTSGTKKRHFPTSSPKLSDKALQMCDSPNFVVSSPENVDYCKRSKQNTIETKRDISSNANTFASVVSSHLKLPNTDTLVEIDAVMKILATSVKDEKETNDANKAVNNLKLLCQNINIDQSHQTDYYCAANQMAFVQRDPCNGYEDLSNQSYPYYLSSANWWYPSTPSYLPNNSYSAVQNHDYGFSSYYGQSVLPFEHQDQIDSGFGAVSSFTTTVSGASSSNMFPNPSWNTQCDVASSMISQISGSSQFISDQCAFL